MNVDHGEFVKERAKVAQEFANQLTILSDKYNVHDFSVDLDITTATDATGRRHSQVTCEISSTI